MSIRSFEHYPPTNEDLPPPVAESAVPLSSVPALQEASNQGISEKTDDRAARTEQQRQRMLKDFYDFSRDSHDIDAKTADTRQEHDLALVVHNYAWSRASNHIEKTLTRATNDPTYTAPDLRLLDYERIHGRINYHYRQFGEDRTVVNHGNRREEETFLLSAKKRATAFIYDDREEESDYVTLQPHEGRRGIPRQQRYPEILLVMELREALIADKAFVTAKSAEITFAAYGSIFPALVRERAIEVLSSAGLSRRILIKTWAAEELPVDELPDKILPRKKKS